MSHVNESSRKAAQAFSCASKDSKQGAVPRTPGPELSAPARQRLWPGEQPEVNPINPDMPQPPWAQPHIRTLMILPVVRRLVVPALGKDAKNWVGDCLAGGPRARDELHRRLSRGERSSNVTGKFTLHDANLIGAQWVGLDATGSSDGVWTSRDGTRRYREPAWKKWRDCWQANVELYVRNAGGKLISDFNAHLDIVNPDLGADEPPPRASSAS